MEIALIILIAILMFIIGFITGIFIISIVRKYFEIFEQVEELKENRRRIKVSNNSAIQKNNSVDEIVDEWLNGNVGDSNE